jgi:hypothetical protein
MGLLGRWVMSSRLICLLASILAVTAARWTRPMYFAIPLLYKFNKRLKVVSLKLLVLLAKGSLFSGWKKVDVCASQELPLGEGMTRRKV